MELRHIVHMELPEGDVHLIRNGYGSLLFKWRAFGHGLYHNHPIDPKKLLSDLTAAVNTGSVHIKNKEEVISKLFQLAEFLLISNLPLNWDGE